MKKEKMSFKNIKDVLGRDEMKKIMAGSGGCSTMSCSDGKSCYTNTSLECKCHDGKNCS
jgi:hypothetical protein